MVRILLILTVFCYLKITCQSACDQQSAELYIDNPQGPTKSLNIKFAQKNLIIYF